MENTNKNTIILKVDDTMFKKLKMKALNDRKTMSKILREILLREL